MSTGASATLAYLGVGSNIEPETNIPRALELLARAPGVEVTAISTFYRTAAEDAPGSPDFYNGVVALRVGMPPHDLRSVLLGVEAACHRRRTADRNAPRTIDLDLLLYGDPDTSMVELRGPDPDITQRGFIAIPLLELAPGLELPGGKGSLADAAARFDTPIGEPLSEFSADLRRRLPGTRSPST